MRAFSVIALVIIFTGKLSAQSIAGMTGICDTSYTTYSAWLSTKKTHPDISIAEELHSPSIAEQRGIMYCNLEKRKLLLDAFYPKQKSKTLRTVILIIHGGGWRSGDRSQHYPLAQRLASLGYICFTPEYRLSTEALYPAAVYDIKSALRWIKSVSKEYQVDTTKITVLGFSAGGELAALMATTNGRPELEGTACQTNYSGTVNALVDIDGTLSFVHPESGEGDDSKRTSAATYWFGYSKKDNPVLWQQASPLSYAGRNTVPTLFINSSVDRMHAGREDYINILHEYNIYSEIRSFEDAPHSFCLFNPWFEPTVKYIDDFLKKVFNK